MSAATLSGLSPINAHSHFTAALPAMRNVVRYQLRKLPKRRRAEAVDDALAACWHCWHGLLKRGKDPLTVGPGGIAVNAARYVKAGRRLGTGTGGRGASDVYSRRAERLLGFRVVGLDRRAEAGADPGSDGWRGWLSEDNRSTPADEAAFRLDFETWLGRLPGRKREMAELLVEGHGTGVVAKMLGVTPAAVSQTRALLEASWRTFQAEPTSSS